jgi:hypothetical protein
MSYRPSGKRGMGTSGIHLPGNNHISGSFRSVARGQGVVPYAYNLKKSNTSRIRAVYQAGARSTLIALSGSSVIKGVDETASPYNTQYGVAVPMQLAALFNAKGINAGANNLYGWSGTSMSDYTTRDGRVAITGAVGTGSNPCLGGAEFALTAAATLSFTPPANVTKADIVFKDAAAGISFSWSVDGGSETTISTLNNNSIRKVTVSLGAAGIHTIKITWIAGNVRIYAIDCYDDTAGRKEISFKQWGISGATASAMVDDTGTPSSGRIKQQNQYPVDLHISECGLPNSWRNGTAVATVKGQLTTFVQAVKTANTDFMFLVPPYDNGVMGNTANQNLYVDAMYEVALSEDVPLIDLRKRWTSFANAVAQGWQVNSDAIHPTKNGQIDIAANVLLNPIQYALAA